MKRENQEFVGTFMYVTYKGVTSVVTIKSAKFQTIFYEENMTKPE